MADLFDQAQDEDARQTERALAAHRARAAKAVHLQAIGECLAPTCGEPLALVGQLFCGPKCAAEHASRCK